MPILRQQAPFLRQQNFLFLANERPSSVWAYLMKQITSSYMQVPEDLQVKFTSAFKCSYKCSVCLTVISTVNYLDSSFQAFSNHV